jgi:hypothetical protein
MSDYSEQGAVPVEDAATDSPPTVDEVAARQEQEYPEQARTSTARVPPTDDRGDHSGGSHPVGEAQARENAELDPPA